MSIVVIVICIRLKLRFPSRRGSGGGLGRLRVSTSKCRYGEIYWSRRRRIVQNFPIL